MPSNIPGYLLPTSTDPLPGGLSLEDFIQSIIVGISGYSGTLVRPKWQESPPKQPSPSTNWIAFGINLLNPDANAYTGLTPGNVDILQRNQAIEVGLSFYGPNAMVNIRAFQDGFQIQQNLEAMRLAQMGFTGFSQAMQVPDLLNERWVQRWETTLVLTGQVQRVYPILSFASAEGTIHTVVSGQEYEQEFNVEEEVP